MGDAGRSVGIDEFGESASGGEVMEHFHINAQTVAEKALESIEAARG